jgi:hypothetical protein
MLYRLASTRAVLIVVGVLSALLAWTTWVSLTDEQLPTRTLCVVVLVATAIVGLGSAIVAPNPHTRGRCGLGLMMVAVCRMWGFGQTTLARTDGIIGFIEGTNAVWVWALVGYLGFLVWARRASDPTRGDRGEP